MLTFGETQGEGVRLELYRSVNLVSWANPSWQLGANVLLMKTSTCKETPKIWVELFIRFFRFLEDEQD